MQFMTGTVVDGKVVLDGVELPEGTVVKVLAEDDEAGVELPPHLLAELNEAIDEAEREKGITVEELLAQLRALDRA